MEIIEMGYQEFAEFQSDMESLNNWIGFEKLGLFIVVSWASKAVRKGENLGVEKVVYIIVANFAPENLSFRKKIIKVGNDKLPN